jgi:uncharacterized lipoprotein YddW (UPF0748 family)
MNRREFLGTMAALAAVPVSAARPPATAKNWAWMRGQTEPVDVWKRKLAVIKKAGVDAILISGDAEFYRKHVRTVHDEGLELHAWMFTMMRGENVQTHPEWYAVSRNGVSTAIKPPYVDYYKFMCPARPEVKDYLRSVMRSIAEVPGLSSLHLDYIRYPDVILPVALWPKYNLYQDREYPDFDFCYCEVCRNNFKKMTGADPLTLQDPSATKAWLQYRYDTITEIVKIAAFEAHAEKKQLTAAVFPTPAIARTLVRQDWTKWPLDAVLPMTYHGFYKEDVAWIEQATREGVTALAGRVPLYSGLYVPDLSPADLGRAVGYAIAGGASGVSLFEANTLTADHWQAFLGAVGRHRHG